MDSRIIIINCTQVHIMQCNTTYVCMYSTNLGHMHIITYKKMKAIVEARYCVNLIDKLKLKYNLKK